MLAQAHYSQKQLHGKNQAAMHEMLHEKGINWADLPGKWKNGRFISKGNEGFTVNTMVIFMQHRAMVEQFLKGEA